MGISVTPVRRSIFVFFNFVFVYNWPTSQVGISVTMVGKSMTSSEVALSEWLKKKGQAHMSADDKQLRKKGQAGVSGDSTLVNRRPC